MGKETDNNDKTQSFIALTSGTSVLHYEILEKIGSGGMGEVYLALDTKLNRKVALKFLPPNLCQDDDCRRRFTREAQAAAGLDHPNIAAIYEVGEFQGRPFYAMQIVEGQSLKDVIAGKDLSIDRILEIGIQVCEGLQAAHDKGIIHRDIKPSNILLDAHGRVRIVDFGLAAIRGSEQLTKTGSTLGTVGYMSPEQVHGKEIDQRSDLFSLGVVLYELITKQNPFKRGSEAATLKAVSDDIPEPLARFKSGLPEGLQGIVKKALEKNTKTRYQHADGMLSDLMRIKMSFESGTSATSAPPPSKHPTRAWWIAVAIVVVAAVILVLTKPWQTDTASRDADRIMLAVLPFENLGDPEDEYFADGITEEITSRLAQLPDLGVISRTSAMQYKESQVGLKQIGEELGVQYILEGTIRWAREGNVDRVRITPQLINVSDDRHLWADNYERSLTQIFAVQSEIAGHVAEALDITLGKIDKTRLEAAPTDNINAYDFFLHGREDFELGKHRGRGETAVKMFERAVALDTSFSMAYAWLARAYGYIYFHHADQDTELPNLVRRAAEAAYRLSSQGPDGNMAMGYYYYYCEKEYDVALQHFSSVLVEQPNNSDAIEAIAYIQRRLGKWEESLESLKRAAELDPRSIRKVIEMQLGSLALRRYDLAREYFELGCRISPDAKDLYERESWRYIMAYGDTRRARQTIEEGQRLIGSDPLAEELELLDILDRDFESALQRRPSIDASLPFDDFDYYLFKGYIYFHLRDHSASLSYFDSARVKYEGIVAQVPDFPVPRSRLAVALAGVGHYEEAVRECDTALSILSRTQDALFYPVVLADAAHVYVFSREYDRAIETLDSILSMPFPLSIETVKLDPFYDPLRDLPRFKALIEKYEKKHGT